MSQEFAEVSEIAPKTVGANVEVATRATIHTLPTVANRQAFSQLTITVGLMALDVLALTIAISLAITIRINILPVLAPVFPNQIPVELFNHIWWILVVGVLCLSHEGLYTKRLSFWRETKEVVRAMTLAFLMVFAVVSLAKMSGEVSRAILVLGYGISIVLLPTARLAMKTILSRLSLGEQPLLILGAGKTGAMVARALLREKTSGYRIVGFLDEDIGKHNSRVEVDNISFPVLGSFRDSDAVMEETGARNLIVAAPGMPGPELVGLANRLQSRASSVTVIPDLFGVPVMGVEADYSFDDQMLSFRIKNNLASPVNMTAKRAFDLVAGSIILIVAAPLMACVALAIKLDSPGLLFFSHKRIGRSGKEFKCYKFRTMHLNNDEILAKYLEANPEAKLEWEQYAKLRNEDPRVTIAGRIMRMLSLDELPQLFNVLKGEMSLVGPRPYLPRESAQLSSYAATIMLARPGITGLWQVNGRSEIDFSGRLDLESWYVRNWSLWLDITLLVRTVGVVLGRRGAY